MIPLDRSNESRPRIRERMRRVLSTPRLILCWVAIWLSAMLTGDYYVRVEAPALNARIALHQDMVTGNAPYAYRYRIFAPYAAEGLARVLQHAPIVSSRPATPPLSYSGLAFTTAYCLLNLAALIVLLWSIGELTWRLWRYDLALLGVAIAAVMVGFTFRDHYYHPWSFWEGAFFALGLLLIHRQQFLLFSALSLFGLVNRETSVFLLVAFLLTTLPRDLSKASAIEALQQFAFSLRGRQSDCLGHWILHASLCDRLQTEHLYARDRRGRKPGTHLVHIGPQHSVHWMCESADPERPAPLSSPDPPIGFDDPRLSRALAHARLLVGDSVLDNAAANRGAGSGRGPGECGPSRRTRAETYRPSVEIATAALTPSVRRIPTSSDQRLLGHEPAQHVGVQLMPARAEMKIVTQKQPFG